MVKPLVAKPSCGLFKLFGHPSKGCAASAYMHLGGLPKSSRGVVTTAFLDVQFSLKPACGSVYSGVLSENFTCGSLTDLLPALAGCSHGEDIRVSSVLVSKFPHSSGNAQLTGSHDSSDASPLTVVLLIPLQA